MKPPDKIKRLVEIFERNFAAYKSSGYKEANVRSEFIEPFFEELGWDVRNRRGWAEAYKDVITEDAIKIGGATKAPDYCFRIGGARKFFVEAKKPSVDIKGEISPAYQLRRYAWSAKLPLSILTDFEEFAVYDCRVRPQLKDNPGKARVMYLTYKDYLDKWEEIAGVFSRNAVLEGYFDKYIESKGKKTTQEVDSEFLKEIENWRVILAKNIALRNPKLGIREVNFAVQRTIDRIIFLRICEDRGIESYGQLQALINGPNTYKRIQEIYHQADEKYNSGIFHFRPEKDMVTPPDELTPQIKVDDNVLKSILKHIYYPESPYEFSVLGVDILGNIYEQFLGKVIRLTKGHHAVVEEKPEVRKAGGVYYTPTYIVDYIVKNTVGKLCEDKTPKQIEKLKILDPACGSGSFLIGAYTYLTDYHRDWYVDNLIPQLGHEGYISKTALKKYVPGKKPEMPIYQGRGGQWYLTTREKKRILLNNIYGVDIDSQAVEVTKLSLLLKVLENENQDTLERQMKLWRERALPDLGNNIKCGNSLIGPDFFEMDIPIAPSLRSPLPSLRGVLSEAEGRRSNLVSFTDEDRYRINAFDWNAEFPEIMKSGGFDAVIGNPPYIRVRHFKEIYPREAEYLEGKYFCATHVWDIYLLIFEKAIILSKKGGISGFIVPIQTLHQPNCQSLRSFLFEYTTIQNVTDCSELRIFWGAIVKNCILVVKKGKTISSFIHVAKPKKINELREGKGYKWPQDDANQNPGLSLKTDLLSPKKILCKKLIKQSWQLSELCCVTFGLRSCAKKKGAGGKERLITSDGDTPRSKPYLEGRDIFRYGMRLTNRYITYIPDEMYSPRSPDLFERKKIISQTMLSKIRLVSTLDTTSYYVEQSLLCIIPHGILTPKRDVPEYPLEFILGVMNSKLTSFYFGTYIIDYSLGGGLIHATPGSQGKILIPRVNPKETAKVRKLVEHILDLNKKLLVAKTPTEKTQLERQIKATDNKINQLVYELYGLTEREIRIVEQEAK